MPTYRTPDVYVEEISVFPPSVAEVETAVPAFIGYTERARRVLNDDLRNLPTRIFNFAEYELLYGGPAAPDIAVALAPEGAGFVATVTPPALTYLLWYAVKMFFDNGGGKCYIVSVGSYADAIEIADLTAGLDAVALEDEPTLLVCPEAVQLGGNGYDTMSQNMLVQCGTLKDRFAILDLFGGGAAAPQDPATLTANRARVGNNHLKYGALYYPFLRSRFNHFVLPDESNVDVTVGGGAAVTLAALGDPAAATLNTAAYNAAKAALLDHHVVVPPSGAVAGVYAATDTARGVWKAPANVGLAGVIEPVVRLDNARQDDLNVDADHRQVDQRDPRLRRQGHAGLGRAHPGRQRQRVALHLGAALLQHGGGVGQEEHLLGGLRAERRQHLGQGARDDRELPDAEVARGRAGRGHHQGRLLRSLRPGRRR